jgi:purine nucleoside phosphorylase
VTSLPSVRFAHIGGSGTWGFRYPDVSLDGHPHLAVRVVVPEIRTETPFGPSPPFRLCRLTDRRAGTETDFLYVWMHGLNPDDEGDAPGRSAVASERVFDVLARAGVREVVVDNSTGGVAEDLRPWDLCVVGDVVDLSGQVPRPTPRSLTRFRDPVCPRLARAIEAGVAANLDGYRALAGRGDIRVKRDGIYVHTPGPWFETPTEDRLYRRLGFDLVGKTAGPEFRLARIHRMCLGILSIVVNPAEGLGDFEPGDLRAIYQRCGPTMARFVLEALAARAAAGPETGACHCADESGPSTLRAFGRFARY